MKRGTRAALVAVCAITLGLAHSAGAAPGDLDPTFGTDGIARTDFQGADNFGLALVLQPDGKIVVGGNVCAPPPGGCDLALARYLPTGALDASFGTGGRVVTDLGSAIDTVFALAQQVDGKLVAVGSGPGSAVVRYDVDGALDEQFADGGVRLGDVGLQAADVAIDAEGRIIVVGAGIARYLGDGSLDPSFGVGGRLSDPASAVAVQPDGRIVAGGVAGLTRYLPDGSVDLSFGTAGRVDAFVYSGALAIQADGKMVIASGRFDTGDFSLTRVLPNGALDEAFGSGGTVVTDFGSDKDLAWAVAVQPEDGKIVAAGGTVSGTGEFALARYLPDGRLDAGFGDGGKVTSDMAGQQFDYAAAVVIQPDGAIVAAGSTYVPSTPGQGDVVVARYIGGATPFDRMDAGIAVVERPAPVGDMVGLSVGFELGAGSDGISPAQETVTIALGDMELRLSPGLDQAGRFRWNFAGEVDGARWTVTLQEWPSGSYTLHVGIMRVDVEWGPVPIGVRVEIGDDAGSATVRPVFLGR